MQLSHDQIEQFHETLWEYYAKNGRSELPWRQPEPTGNFDPYKVLVSELMLQQTQVARVIPKYHVFLARFPTAHDLAASELGDVLRQWQGLGYNRRAKFLWQAAQAIEQLGSFPTSLDELVKLPGVGANTAGAILAYAYNAPVVFIETNIRSVYIHHFFADEINIADTQIRALVEQTLDHEQSREFYWALMDYGSHLKATAGNSSRASKHYAKQSSFAGSRRQVRGQVLRLLGERPMTLPELASHITDGRLIEVLAALQVEQLIRGTSGMYSL